MYNLAFYQLLLIACGRSLIRWSLLLVNFSTSIVIALSLLFVLLGSYMIFLREWNRLDLRDLLEVGKYLLLFPTLDVLAVLRDRIQFGEVKHLGFEWSIYRLGIIKA